MNKTGQFSPTNDLGLGAGGSLMGSHSRHRKDALRRPNGCAKNEIGYPCTMDSTTAFDINGTLLRHIATGGGMAFSLRSRSPSLPNVVAQFFAARTDIRRLQRAQTVAKLILEINDLSDLLAIREIVARQELRRLIKYEKQKDHTAHTVYLYLLGVWFFDNVLTLPEAFLSQKSRPREDELSKWFLFRWVYSSLLHDIGYAFHDLSPETKSDRELIDSVYSWKWLDDLYPPSSISDMARGALERAHKMWCATYDKMMHPPTAAYANDGYIHVIRRLSQAPWLGDLDSSMAGKDVFDVLSLDSDLPSLRGYAEEVAANGYGGHGPCVDHAVGSGLLLFQYSSYFYWLMDHVRKSSASAFAEVGGRFDYEPANVRTQVAAACRAVGYHNIQPNVAAAAAIIPRLTLDADPILFLSIVCDELQTWDRHPAGVKHLDEYQTFALSSLESDNVELTCKGEMAPNARFHIVHDDAHTITESIRASLRRRVPNHERIVEVT